VIDSLSTYLEPFFQQPFFQWLLHTSWQAGVLVCLILLVQRALGRWLGARGSYYLWLVLLIRLTLPAAPHSRVSVYNLLPPPQLASHELALAALSQTSVTRGPGKAGPAVDGPREDRAATGWGAPARHWLQRQTTTLFLLWLAGACTLTASIVAGHIRLWRIVRRERPMLNRRIHRLLRECQKQMGIKRAVDVIATGGVGGPALFGFVRPRLLLPKATLAELRVQQLRHIFLHELAHLRRDDIVIGYLATLLHVLHWFNPLLALGFKRMRADRELVCDELALASLPAGETTAYGRTIVHQIEQWHTSRPQRMLAALSGDKARIKQRIALISRFRKETYRASPLAIGLAGLLACTGLTNGRPVRQLPVYGPARNVPTTHQDKHANIERISIRHRDTGKYLAVLGQTVACDANSPGDAGLWEARFDEALGSRDRLMYFYSVATCKYLTWDREGNVAANGPEPNESARWSVWSRGDGFLITPYPFAHLYLRAIEQGQVKAPYGTGPGNVWDINALWRVKTSDDPKSEPEFRRRFIPGPDWGPPWSTLNRNK
jgi:beta-lactamase regulating signal transducer with metallopeptidase domain